MQSQVIGDGGPLTDAELLVPLGLAIDSAGSLYIVDTGFNRIRKVTAGGVLSTAAGTDGTGSTDGPATQAVLGLPFAVVRDHSGNLFTADFYTNIRRVAVDGSITTLGGYVPGGSDEGRVDKVDFHSLDSLAIDAQDNVYVASPSAVQLAPAHEHTQVLGLAIVVARQCAMHDRRNQSSGPGRATAGRRVWLLRRLAEIMPISAASRRGRVGKTADELRPAGKPFYGAGIAVDAVTGVELERRTKSVELVPARDARRLAGTLMDSGMTLRCNLSVIPPACFKSS